MSSAAHRDLRETLTSRPPPTHLTVGLMDIRRRSTRAAHVVRPALKRSAPAATSTSTPTPETANAAGGEKSAAITPPSRKPAPVAAEPIDSSRLVTRACRSAGVASCSAVSTATHWIPLPAPPTTENAHATHSSRVPAMPR